MLTLRFLRLFWLAGIPHNQPGIRMVHLCCTTRSSRRRSSRRRPARPVRAARTLFVLPSEADLLHAHRSSYCPHALSGFSEFGSDEPNEFATFVQGREAWDGNSEVRSPDSMSLLRSRSLQTCRLAVARQCRRRSPPLCRAQRPHRGVLVPPRLPLFWLAPAEPAGPRRAFSSRRASRRAFLASPHRSSSYSGTSTRRLRSGPPRC